MGPDPWDASPHVAAARAHRQTGCPILTHTEQTAGAHAQCDLLAAEGVQLEHVVLSHVDRRVDVGYHRSLLERGVRLEYDEGSRWPGPGNPTVDLLSALAPAFPHQLLVGTDAARRRYWKAYGGAPGLSFLATTFADRLCAAGLTAQTVRDIFVNAPASAYAFTTAR